MNQNNLAGGKVCINISGCFEFPYFSAFLFSPVHILNNHVKTVCFLEVQLHMFLS